MGVNMTKTNFVPCLGVTLQQEGGWADNPKDPGGATMKGITLATFRHYVPGATKADLRAISDEWVQMIYRDGYWAAVRGDDLPAGVDLATFDFAVNSGPSRAVKILQGVVGVAQDGKIGRATLTAIKGEDSTEIVKEICARRLSFVRGLKTFGTFGKGWVRRVVDVEARGVAMAMASRGFSAVVVNAAMAAEADAASMRADKQGRSAGALAGGGAGTGAVVGGDVNWWLVIGLVVICMGVVALVRSRAQINRERAAAYTNAMNVG